MSGEAFDTNPVTWRAEVPYWRGLLDTEAWHELERRTRARADRDVALVAAWWEVPAEGVLEAVGAMHAPTPEGAGRFSCVSCIDEYGDVTRWPCPTADLILKEMGAKP